MKFKVGDLVTLKLYNEVEDHYSIDSASWEIYREASPLCVEMVAKRGVHGTCVLLRRNRLALWFPIAAITPVIEQHTIVIYNKGTTTTAIEKVNGEEVKRATAKLNPNDKYDWVTGRNLALNRLLYGTDYHPAEVAIKPEEPKYYNGKVVCIENSTGNKNNYTVGKVYEFVDGHVVCDTGFVIPNKKVKSFSEWCDYSSSKWLEIVE